MSTNEEIPDGWETVQIEEILAPRFNGKTIQQGWSPRCERFPSEGNEKWGVLKTTAIQEGEFLQDENKQLPKHLDPREQIEVKAGDIVMTCAGPRNRCGVACLISDTRPKLMMSGKMYRFRPVEEHFNSKFLEFILHSQEAKKKIDRMKTGINDSGLNLTHDRFRQLLVPVAPKNEQDRIVAKIEELFSELDKGIESLKTAREQLKVYRQALLKHAFEGKLTEQWRKENADKLPACRDEHGAGRETADQLLERIKQEREARYQQQVEEWKVAVKQWEDGGKEGKKPAKPRQAKLLKPEPDDDLVLPDLPNDWAWLLLGENNLDVFDGPFGSNLKTSDYVDEGVRVIRLENIGAQQFINEKKSFISETKYQQLKKHTVRSGDLVFSSFVTENTRVALVPETIDRAVNKADCFCIRTVGNTLDERLLEAFLSSRFVFKHIEGLVHGVGRPRINTTQLKSIPIPMTSIEEQREILEKLEMQLSEVSQLEQDIDCNLAKSEVLRQSILKKAFSGQLVPQDPNDEPASVLLERITKEKEAAAKAKKAKTAKKKSKQVCAA